MGGLCRRNEFPQCRSSANGSHHLDPSLYDFTDLIARTVIARAGACFDWHTLSAKTPKVLPAQFALDPVYPNPFNSQTRVSFRLAVRTPVEVTVYDILGRQAVKLAGGVFEAGSHELLWDACDLSSGLYFIEARTPLTRSVQKAMLLK